MKSIQKSFAIGAALALATASVAAADPGEHGHSGEHGHAGEHGHSGEHGHAGDPKTVSYVFKGAYVDETTVDVVKGNHHAKRAELTEGPVSFDFSAAKVVVADTNGDGSSDLADVTAGDKVVVKVRAPKDDPGAEPLAARQLVDQSADPDDADSTDDADNTDDADESTSTDDDPTEAPAGI